MSIIVFGGSFDPIHNGHIKMALCAKNFFKAKKVLFLIAKNPRWKNPHANDFERLEMLKIALKERKWAEIDLTEFNSNDSINYTYDSIKTLKEKYNDDLIFLIGADQLDQLHRWYKIDELAKICRLCCILREDFSLNVDNVNKYQVTIINKKVNDMSSTKLREMKDLNAPIKVIDYIIEKNLYFANKLKSYFTTKRFNHSLSVAHLCYKIALKNQINPYKAFLCGLVHDIGKEAPMVLQKQYMLENYPNLVDEIPSQLYHQFYSVKILINDFKIDDKKIIDGVIFHATGNKIMSKYAMITYAADKIDPLRGYDSSALIKECIKNYYQGFKLVLEVNIKFLKENNKSFDNILTEQCIQSYLKGENK